MDYVKRYFTSLFSHGNHLMFDDDFRLILQCFYLCGFFRPDPSMQRNVYGLTIIIFGPMSYIFGALREAATSFSMKEIQRSLICISYAVFQISTLTQVLTFVAKEKSIIESFKSFQSMHGRRNSDFIAVYCKKMYKLTKFYTIYLAAIMTLIIILFFLDFKVFKFIIPTFYDDYAEGNLYFPLLGINIISIYMTVITMSSTDLIHVICMVRAGANLEALNDQLLCCTDSEDLSTNEKNLVCCIRYHQKITK